MQPLVAAATGLPRRRGSMGGTLVVPKKKLEGKDRPGGLVAACEYGLFLNEHTLEVELFKCGRHKSMCSTLLELTEVKKAAERAEAWKENPATLDVERFLKDIEQIGKGRFAQRLASKMTGNRCPANIKQAFDYVVDRCS